MVPHTPSDDTATRIHLLRTLRVFDASHNAPFDRFARAARRMFDVPMALVRLVPPTLDVGAAFDAIALETDGAFVVEDAAQDPRFASEAIVAGPPNVRFFASCAVRTPDGAALGTLSVLDRLPRAFSHADRLELENLAARLAAELAAVEQSAIDPGTGLLNRHGFQAFAAQWRERARATKEPLSWIFLTLESPQDDVAAWRDVAEVLRREARDQDVLSHRKPNEFAVLLPDACATTAELVSLRIHQALAELADNKLYELKFRIGLVTIDPHMPSGVTEAHDMLAG